MSLRGLLLAAAAVLAALAIFLGGVVVGGHPEATGLTRLADPLRGILLGDSGQDLPGQVLEALRDDYYEPLDEAVLEQASVEGIIAALGDPYTEYLDPEELEALRQSYDGAYSGVGLSAERRDGEIVVVQVDPDGPAGEAGIRAGDRIVAVDGTPTAGLDLGRVVTRIRGPEGTEVRLAVEGRDGRRELTLTRRRITLPPVASRVERAGGASIGYLRLARFTRGAGTAMRRAVEGLRERGVTGLVLDLRGDPGGLVTEAVDVAGVFLPDGTPVVVTEGRSSPRRTYRTDGRPASDELPLVVLVDRGSASSSEIVAGALRDAGRGRLVGERTFGKALVQSTRLLRDGGALKLTTAHYLTPTGFDLARRGLPPSVRAVDDPATARDEALRRAVALAAEEAP
jgi:carboxyl-terminal processing protease